MLHASNMVVPIDTIRITHGEDRVRAFKVPDAKYFTQCSCADCGPTVPTIEAGRGIAIVPRGRLDDAPRAVPSEHIWVGSKASWHEIPDSLPQYLEGPPA